MADVIRQLAVKTEGSAAVPFDIGSKADKVLYEPNSESLPEYDPDNPPKTVEAALNYLAIHKGSGSGGGSIQLFEFAPFSSLPQRFVAPDVTSSSIIIDYELTNPAAQRGTWTITTGSDNNGGYIQITGLSSAILGSTGIKVIIGKPASS